MSTPNPFSLSMTRLYLPAGMGTTVSVGGFTLEADEKRSIEVPNSHVKSLQSHGLTTDEPVAAVDAKKK